MRRVFDGRLSSSGNYTYSAGKISLRNIMKTRWFALLLVISLATRASAEFRAAIAVRTVTPDPLLPVVGGIGTGSAVTNKAGELTVRALVLADDNSKVAIVSSDFLGFPSALGNKVRARIKSIPAENILIGATHTHSAPDCYGFPNGTGGT